MAEPLPVALYRPPAEPTKGPGHWGVPSLWIVNAMGCPADQQSRRHEAWAAGMALFALMTGHALMETARDAIFLSRLPATQLPWAYLAIAAFALLAARANRGVTGRWDKSRVLATTMFILAAGTLGFWALFGLNGDWVAHAFYVWSGVVATVAVVQLWLLLGEVFTLTEAKRLYAPIAAGGVLGAIAGSGLSELLLHWVQARQLLLVSSVFLAGAGLLPRMCSRAEEPQRCPRTIPSPIRSLEQTPRAFVRKLLSVTLLSTVALTTVDFLFKSEVARTVAAAELGSFFARFYLALNVLALGVQLLLSPRLLRTLG
ncbi:MAG: hypothetical protein ACOC1F_06070, partial [Myxococcota bacterium]